MKSLYNVLEQWADKVKPKWHPKEGLFTGDNPQEIANYLLNHSESKSQAMQRLVFYMNRAGDKLTNKTVLNKVKKLLSESLLDKDFDVDEKHIFKYSKDLFETFKNCEWKQKQRPGNSQTEWNVYHKKHEDMWKILIDYIGVMNSEAWNNRGSHSTPNRKFVELYLFYPYSSSSDQYSASYARIHYRGQDILIQGSAGSDVLNIEISKVKVTPRGNYTTNFVPEEFIDLIQIFTNNSISESLLDKDFDVQVTTLDDVLNERHRWMINDDIKSLAKWMTSQRWSKKKDYYITTPTHQKKYWIESCISRIAYNAGAGAMGTCGYIKMTTGNIYYMYCPAGDKFSIVTIDLTGDDVKFSYELGEKHQAGGHIVKNSNEKYLGSWPGKLNDYLIEHI